MQSIQVETPILNHVFAETNTNTLKKNSYILPRSRDSEREFKHTN